MDSHPLKHKAAPCRVCSKIGNKLCGNCRQAHYCSSKHQMKDWLAHSTADCFPIIIKDDPNLGQHLIAGRDIMQGEVILREEALIAGPFGVLCGNVSLCLGCCCVILESTLMSGPNLCSICKWPVCGIECEKKSGHADNECKIFAEHKVPAVIFGSSEDFHNIFLLRCLLLRNYSPMHWHHLMNLFPKANPKYVGLLDNTIQFVHQTCGLVDFDPAVIAHVDGIIRDNVFADKPDKGIILALLGHGLKIRLMLPLLDKSRLISHSCVPNCKFVVEEFESENSVTTTTTIFTTVAISAGQPFKLSYTEVMTGTKSRRLSLLAEQMFNCTCDRCQDPTELGTYFSAVKCPECPDGYFLPENSLDYRDEAIWRCNDEQAHVKTQREIRAIEDLVSAQIRNSRPCATETLDEILKKHSGVTLHTNHFLLQDLKQDIIFEMAALLRRGNYGGEKPFIDYLFKRTLELTNDCLRVADCLYPGWNEYRGILLHALAQMKYQLCAKNIGQLTRAKFQPYVEDLMTTFDDGRNSLAAAKKGSVANRLYEELSLFQSLVSGQTTLEELGIFKFPQIPVKLTGLDPSSSYSYGWSESGPSDGSMIEEKASTSTKK